MAPKLKLTYFNAPGRAEATRILLTLGKVPFEDATIDHSSWPQVKPKTPFGQVPILEVDDKVTLAQSGAIVRYAANLAGFMPTDPLEIAKADMADFQFHDAVEPLFGTMQIKDPEEAKKARAELVSGSFHTKMEALDKLVASSGGDFVLGGKMTWVDVELFCSLSALSSGVLTGVPKDVLTKYPALKKLRDKVARQPDIAARYASADPSDAMRAAFKPSA